MPRRPGAAVAADDAFTQAVRFLRIPPFCRPSSAAWLLGQYCSLETAANTFVFVLRDTVPEPFTTRDTVAVETPARRAMSLTVKELFSLMSFSLIDRRPAGWGQTLEVDPHPDQHVAWRVGRRGLSEAAIRQIGVDTSTVSGLHQVDAIENIKNIEA